MMMQIKIALNTANADSKSTASRDSTQTSPISLTGSARRTIAAISPVACGSARRTVSSSSAIIQRNQSGAAWVGTSSKDMAIA